MIKRILKKIGLSSQDKKTSSKLAEGIPVFNLEIFAKVKPYTMTSLQRVSCLIDAVNYIEDNKIEGDFVECGVWKGGSVMTMAYTLLARNSQGRKIHLFDTFDGMTPPTDDDEDLRGIKAADRLATEDKETSKGWAYSPLNEVKTNIYKTGYPSKNFNLVQGKVEDTIPKTTIERIALLRLDTDWYESTKVELEYLFPRLEKGGILIIDDYGHWKGCKKAVDEYFKNQDIKIFLASVDYTGRVAVKLDK